jgi:SPX domain protein involved in polyphosphate accumulation
MYHHRLQTNRFELKYIVNAAMIAHIRNFIRPHLVLDEYARPELGNAYAIHSLYLDSPDLSLCEATLQGHKNRFKIRIRFYDEDPASPVYFEIKRRVNDIIQKERAAVRRDAVLRLLNKKWPDPSDLVEYSPKNFATLERFCSMRDMLNADGKVFVSYIREAYVSPNDEQIRITFDHQLQAGRYDSTLRMFQVQSWLQPRMEGVVLELKFCDRYPFWMHDLAQEFNLQRTAMAKYVTCVESQRFAGPRLTCVNSRVAL